MNLLEQFSQFSETFEELYSGIVIILWDYNFPSLHFKNKIKFLQGAQVAYHQQIHGCRGWLVSLTMARARCVIAPSFRTEMLGVWELMKAHSLPQMPGFDSKPLPFATYLLLYPHFLLLSCPIAKEKKKKRKFLLDYLYMKAAVIWRALKVVCSVTA